jgi:hypothetical protein
MRCAPVWRARRPRFQDARRKTETTKTKQSKTSQSVMEHELLEVLLHGTITIPVTVVSVVLAPGTPYFSWNIRDQVTLQVCHDALIQVLLHEDWPLTLSTTRKATGVEKMRNTTDLQ